MQPDGSKAQEIHLRSGVLAPDITMTTSVAHLVNSCPNNFICYRINDSQIQCLIVVKMDGFFFGTNAVDDAVARSMQSRKG